MPKGPVETLYKDYIVKKGSGSDGDAVGHVNSDLKSPKLVMEVKVEGVDGALGDYVRGLS